MKNIGASGIEIQGVLKGGAIQVIASVSLSANDLVNLYNDAGTLKCRKADPSQAYAANGFVDSDVSASGIASIFTNGVLTKTGLTVGKLQFLGSTGLLTEVAPSSTGSIIQEIGVAISTTKVLLGIKSPIVLG